MRVDGDGTDVDRNTVRVRVTGISKSESVLNAISGSVIGLASLANDCHNR